MLPSVGTCYDRQPSHPRNGVRRRISESPPGEWPAIRKVGSGSPLGKGEQKLVTFTASDADLSRLRDLTERGVVQ